MEAIRNKAGLYKQELYAVTLCTMLVMVSVTFVFQPHPRSVYTVERIDHIITHYEIGRSERSRNKANESLSEYDRIVQGLPSDRLHSCPNSIGSEYSCQSYTADWVGRADLKQLLEERMQLVRDRCAMYRKHLYNASLSKYGKSSNSKEFTMKRIMTNDRLNLAFCWVPKTGSTFMRHVWPSLNRAPVRAIPSLAKRSNGMSALYLQSFWKSEESKLASKRYTAFTVSRSPWQRLVSVYREKCEQTGSLHRCKLDFGYRCSRSNHVLVTFKSFIQCVIDMMSVEDTEYYGHIEPSYKRCGICDYPYQYIILMENLVNESEYIFKEAGLVDPLEVMEKVRTETIRPIEIVNVKITYTDYWKQVSPQMIDNIRFLYRYELLLFDYPETPFLIP